MGYTRSCTTSRRCARPWSPGTPLPRRKASPRLSWRIAGWPTTLPWQSEEDGIIFGASSVKQMVQTAQALKKGKLSDEAVKGIEEIWESVRRMMRRRITSLRSRTCLLHEGHEKRIQSLPSFFLIRYCREVFEEWGTLTFRFSHTTNETFFFSLSLLKKGGSSSPVVFFSQLPISILYNYASVAAAPPGPPPSMPMKISNVETPGKCSQHQFVDLITLPFTLSLCLDQSLLRKQLQLPILIST